MKVEVRTYRGVVDKVFIDGKDVAFDVKDYDEAEEKILTFYNSKDYYLHFPRKMIFKFC